jgi:outer membrane protein OmpA-like peptidoglycan-associated protein
MGPGFSGKLVRPFFRAGLGADFQVTRAMALGPLLAYCQLLEPNTVGSSSDARFVWLGISLSLRPALFGEQAAPPMFPALVARARATPPEPPAPSPTEPSTAPSPQLIELIERTLPTDQVELLAPVLFEYDSDTLEPTGIAMLHEVASELTRRDEIELLEIRGYADSRGGADYNRELSARRAKRVLQWLVEHGIAQERLQIAAQGASDFVENEATEPAHEQNRRVVFRVVRMRKP